jgi:hypothetical protein
MMFFKLSIALLAPLAALAVPVPSPASHYRHQDDGSFGTVGQGPESPDPTVTVFIIETSIADTSEIMSLRP